MSEELKELQKVKINTPVGMTSFPSLFKAKEFNGKSKFECTILVDKDADLTKLKQLVKDMMIAKWGKKPAKFTSPFKDGNDKDLDKYPTYEDKIVLTGASQYMPQSIDENMEEILDENDVYAGCEGRMALSAYPWEYMGKHGVSFNIVAYQKKGDGERIGGRASAVDLFGDGETTTETKSEDDFDL
jgi:hypothetical protein